MLGGYEEREPPLNNGATGSRSPCAGNVHLSAGNRHPLDPLFLCLVATPASRPPDRISAGDFCALPLDRAFLGRPLLYSY